MAYCTKTEFEAALTTAGRSVTSPDERMADQFGTYSTWYLSGGILMVWRIS